MMMMSTAERFRTVREAQAHSMLHGVRVEVRTRAAVVWIHACRVLRWVFGERRAVALAEAGAWRLARWRLDGGPWQRFARDDR